MVRKIVVGSVCLILLGFVAGSPRLVASSADVRVADAAMQGDRAAVVALLKQGADVSGAQGDGMTALHWAVTHDDLEMAQALLAAGANVKAVTRLGGYTPLLLASRNGDTLMIWALLRAGADANAKTSTGTTPLMLASAAGNAETVKLLVGYDANINAKETALGQTALMFAAAANRADVIKVLLAHAADPKIASKVADPAAARGGGAGGGGGRGARGAGAPGAPGAAAGGTGAAGAAGAGAATAGLATPPDPAQATAGGQAPQRGGRGGGRGGGGAAGGGANAAAGGQPPDPNGGGNNNGDDSRPAALDAQGGMTPLLFAARQGHLDAVRALVEGGASVNQVSPGDKTSPILIATINGHFDVAKYLLDHGANPDLASTAGATPLYAALGVQYAPHAFYPQPSPAQEKLSHLELMTALLEHGADPNVRLTKKLWYTGYNFDQSGVDAKGSTPFWRAAQAADVDAMKLLVYYGADPTIPSDGNVGAVRQGNGRTDGPASATARVGTKIVAGVTPLQMASGAGYDGNFQVVAPGGFMPALQYLVEVLHADVTEVDYRGYAPVHNAAFRGDNEMLRYLISKGADVLIETRSGDTTIDLANGPVQRLQPFPETIAFLEQLGVKNNNRCKSCGGH